MTPATQNLLEIFHFHKLGVLPCGRVRYQRREKAPDMLIDLPPEALPEDLIQAVFASGAAMQRHLTRVAYNKMCDTFREGQRVAALPEEMMQPPSDTPALWPPPHAAG